MGSVKIIRPVIAVCLCFILLFSLIPLSFAEENSTEVAESEMSYENDFSNESADLNSEQQEMSELNVNENAEIENASINNLMAASSLTPSIDVAKLTSVSGPDFSHTNDAYLTDG